jgi:hypothetical protein
MITSPPTRQNWKKNRCPHLWRCFFIVGFTWTNFDQHFAFVHLSIKEGNLFVCHVEISQSWCFPSHSRYNSKAFDEYKRTMGALKWFCNMQSYMLQKLLNIEQFCHWKFNKMKTKNFSAISVCSWHYLKMINDYDLWGDFLFLKPKLQEILNFG